MSSRLHLLVPMSGQGVRYQKAGYTQPKPLVPVSGVPMIERLLGQFPEAWPAHFVLAENHRQSGLPELLGRLRPAGTIQYVAPHTLGPGHALLTGLDSVPDDAPVLVSYCDYGMVWDAGQFERFVTESGCDACLISYRGFHAHYLSPVKYAYSRMDGERVVEVREKGSFTDRREDEYASAGGYYFRSAALLRAALRHQLESGLSLNGEFYTSLTVQALLAQRPDADVRVFEIPGFFQWGTPEDLQTFEYWEAAFRSYNRTARARGEVAQVLLPMAGLGSRFAQITPLPKPLIPVAGRAMYRAALDSLPAAGRTVVVALESFAGQLAQTLPAGAEVVALPVTPPGQALSTEAGVSRLAPEGDVIVTACDHGVVLPPERWAAFQAAPGCDAAIFTLRGFPGAVRRPRSYSYVVPTAEAGPFPTVERVSLKQNPSADPRNDHVLVGTFWFRDKTVLQRGIDELKRRDLRVNGELYLDAIFDLLPALGHPVRMIPLDGYICWGEPDALAESLYWQEIFTGRRIDQRLRYPGMTAHVGG
ncbi:MAG: NTP transferase domain-containing protein [Deltaproteobacteria bacterium]|nr:NTP transferase domain-containing protein [Deltaproteobacteria bacterium]